MTTIKISLNALPEIFIDIGPGLYVHVPFCLRKCPYCSFYSVPVRKNQLVRYLDAVKGQVQLLAKDPWCRTHTIATIFFGGGTPSILPADRLSSLLDLCQNKFFCEPGKIETSIEVNPATIDLDGLKQLRRAGFNRISIGVQSLDDVELKELGRLHTAADALQTVRQARRAGFDNLSMDLMYGLPGQAVQKWSETLDKALSVTPEHLSIYELTLEADTPFAVQARRGTLQLPAEEEMLEMMDISGRLVTTAGLQRYEISNYARPGRECRHNINYWQNGSYIGLGPGAVSCLSGRRLTTIADVEHFCRYLEIGEDFRSHEEVLDTEARFRETVIMGLRMIAGVSLKELRERFGINAIDYYGKTLSAMLDHDLLAVEEQSLRLTKKGLPVANAVMAELV